MPLIASLLLPAIAFAPAIPWANGFAPGGRIPLVADVNGDGYADLLAVNQQGEGFIDVALNGKGIKCQIPRRARSRFGNDLVSAVWVSDGVVAVSKDGSAIVASNFNGAKFTHVEPWTKPVPVTSSATIPNGLGSATSLWRTGDIDADGDLDLIEFRNLPQPHDGNNVLIHRLISDGETDSDHDGLTNDTEASMATDPLNPDTDGDGLPDAWEVATFQDQRFTEPCDPRHADVVCLISRFKQVDEKFCHDQLNEAKRYYASLESPNPDGKLGWNLHLIYLDPLEDADQSKPWWENRDRLIPSNLKGYVHWMQISPNGGGQADQLGDGGGCGGGGWALYATFIHEFGHQLGLSHEGFYRAAWCPTYPSLMNYAYTYTLEGNIRNIRYSDGRLANYTMNESNLSETIPLPYDKVKFLEAAPYHYRLKAEGDHTLVDWNWNGVYGEPHIRADINYSYSTTAGRRDDVGKTHSAPWLFTVGKTAYVLVARHNALLKAGDNPNLSVEHPGSLYLRRLVKPYEWAPESKLTDAIVTGDPTAIEFDHRPVIAYPVKQGVEIRGLFSRATVPVGSPGDIPSLAVMEGRLLLTLTNPETQQTSYAWWNGSRFGRARTFNFLSKNGVGLAIDTLSGQLIVGLTQDQTGKPGRWQVRRYSLSGDTLFERRKDWVEGEGGDARGSSRPVILFDPSSEWGSAGRTYFFALGTTTEKAPWSCAFVAHTIGDSSVRGGWRVKRYYDEWTQSRSTPAAAFYDDDIIYGYRWVDGGNPDRDNVLHVAYRGSGIEEATMGDFDDIGFIRNFGMRYSILYRSN